MADDNPSFAELFSQYNPANYLGGTGGNVGQGYGQQPGLGSLTRESMGGRDLSFNDVVAANRNSLVGLGLGMMSGGFGGGMKGYETGASADEAAAARLLQNREQQQHMALQRELGYLTSDIKNWYAAGKPGTFQQWLEQKKLDEERFFGNPIPVQIPDPTDPTGQRMIQGYAAQSNRGRTKVLDFGPGAQPATSPGRWVDDGTGQMVFVPNRAFPVQQGGQQPPAPQQVVPPIQPPAPQPQPQQTTTGPEPIPPPDVPARPTIGPSGVPNIPKDQYRPEFQKKSAEGQLKELETLRTDAAASVKQDQSLRILNQLNNAGVAEGATGPALQQMQSIAAGLGMAPKEVADRVARGDLFTAISQRLVLEAAGGSLGVGFSNADRDFLQNTVPTMTQTADGRRLLIDVQMRMNARKRQIAVMAERWAATGRMAEFTQQLGDWAERNPLFADLGGQRAGGGKGDRQGIPTISSAAERDKLSPGQQYYDPNGTLRTKR